MEREKAEESYTVTPGLDTTSHIRNPTLTQKRGVYELREEGRNRRIMTPNLDPPLF